MTDQPPRFEPTPFRCHPLLSNQHVQTIHGTIFPRRFTRAAMWRGTGETREFVMPDGDRLTAVLHRHPDDPGLTRPLLIILHGLEGDADSHYVQGLSSKAHVLGFHSLRLNYRGCGGTAHLTQRLYHGFMIEDIDQVVRTLTAEAPWPIVLVGVSLGANKILRLLGTYGDAPPKGLLGAVAISPPIDFLQTNVAFRQGVNRVYDEFFLRKLKAKLRKRRAHVPNDQAFAALSAVGLRAKRLGEFDEAVTAPLGGFKDAHEYYVKAGSGPYLGAIRVPTLILHAEDDPLIPMAMFHEREGAIAANPNLSVHFTSHGGHVGFMESPRAAQAEPWMDHFWAENQALLYTQWLLDQQPS